MSTAKALPLIACGKHAAIAQAAAKNVQPEYEYIHVCLSVDSACADIPLLLDGQTPENSQENVGSANYSQPPVAVVFGAGFEEEEFDAVLKTCESKSNVPFLRFDTSQATPPLGPEYGIYVAKRLKARLQELESQGNFGKHGVFSW